MTLASHYRCFGKPLSPQGRIISKLIPNAHAGDEKWLKDILEELPYCGTGRHGNEDHGDQIVTRWHASQAGNLAMFVTRVQSAFVVVGMTGESAEWRAFADINEGVPPLA